MFCNIQCLGEAPIHQSSNSPNQQFTEAANIQSSNSPKLQFTKVAIHRRSNSPNAQMSAQFIKNIDINIR
jgi:hypothetical protein